jgi:transcriptional regulator
MYIPQDFKNNNIEQLHHFIVQYNFATLVSHCNGEMQVTHIPVMLDTQIGIYGTLTWHMAQLNEHHKHLNGNTEALFIFHGPHAYISPTWYKRVPSVPTWNYAVVHVRGIPQMISQAQLSDDLTKMVDYHESILNLDKSYNIPKDYKQKLLDHIVGFKMEIKQIEGKFKLGQNRSLEDQMGVLQGLKNTQSSEGITLANFIENLNTK